jgi:beta-N-acetylhexosaminidase
MLIVGIEGAALTAQERTMLLHPAIAGVILFARNIVDRDQSLALIDDIRALRETPLLVCVDQEGGPVQRFREGYAALPPLARLGALYDHDPDQAIALTREHAWLMASEMRAIGIDFSYAPVLDLARGNRAIGDRAFHSDPAVCAVLGKAYIEAMKAAGMRTTGKHFPGHGSVLEDTHYSEAIDRRRWPELASADLVPFQTAIEAGVDAMMMAHVTYPNIAPEPAGYSEHWIRHILRDAMGFDGIVVSDDIAMVAAEGAGAVGRRVQLHLEAGCDVVLVCKPELVEEAIDAVPWDHLETAQDRLAALSGRGAVSWQELTGDPRYANAVAALTALA